MRVVCAPALLAALLGLPALAGASSVQKIPDLSGFPIRDHARISPEELAARVTKLPLPAPKKSRSLQIDPPANIRIVDDVPLLEVEACAEQPGQTEEEPTCAVYHAYDFDGEGEPIPFYDYTWSTTIMGRQLIDTFGDETTTYLLFNQYPTDDFGGGFYMPIYSEVDGIGASDQDLRNWFGSTFVGKLRGIVSMNMWWNCDWGHWFQEGCADEAPFATTFRSLHGVIGQEVGHEWGVFLEYLNENNFTSSQMLGRDRSHWSYWLNSGGSPLEGNHWIDLGDGKFEIEHVPYTKFSDFDLYAMGLLPPDEVQPTFYIRPENCNSRECSAATPPESGRMSITGERVDVGIDRVIATMGERFPAYENASRFHRQLFVFTRLVGETDEATTDFALAKLGRIRRFWNEYFYEATRTRMRAITTISGRDDYPRFEFTIGDEGFKQFGSSLRERSVDGRLEVTAIGGSTGVRNDNVQIVTERYGSAVVRVALPATAAGKNVRLTFGGIDGVLDTENAVEIESPIADGVARSYGVNLAGNPAWTGTVGSVQIELVDAAAGDVFAVDRFAALEGAFVDEDGDRLLDTEDNCPDVVNEDQADSDDNGVGDACQDDDGDGVPDVEDNCPDLANADQADSDVDGIGDACEDTDGDGALDTADNCPEIANEDQVDANGDGVGDACTAATGGKKKKSGGCSGAAALPSTAGLILAGLALARRRRA